MTLTAAQSPLRFQSISGLSGWAMSRRIRAMAKISYIRIDAEILSLDLSCSAKMILGLIKRFGDKGLKASFLKLRRHSAAAVDKFKPHGFLIQQARSDR